MRVLKGEKPPADIARRFNSKKSADGSRIEDVVVGLHSTNWRLNDSGNAPADETVDPDATSPTPDQLDYAFVRLASAIGEQPFILGVGADSKKARLAVKAERTARLY